MAPSNFDWLVGVHDVAPGVYDVAPPADVSVHDFRRMSVTFRPRMRVSTTSSARCCLGVHDVAQPIDEKRAYSKPSLKICGDASSCASASAQSTRG